MILSTWKQISAIHILLNISITQGNQTMKLAQLIEFIAKTIFL